MYSAPTDFNDPVYRRALTHSLCMGPCGEPDARMPFYVIRASRSGAALPNLHICADCLGDVLCDCLRRRETPRPLRTGDGTGGLHAPPPLPDSVALSHFQGDLFTQPDRIHTNRIHPDKEIRDL